MPPAIHAESLGKRYRIGAPAGKQTLREAVAAAAAAPLRRLLRRPATDAETIWAVRDVDLEVQHGEADIDLATPLLGVATDAVLLDGQAARSCRIARHAAVLTPSLCGQVTASVGNCQRAEGEVRST